MAIFFKTIRNTIKHWYVPAIIGALFIVLGGYLFTVPESAYLSLVMLFSISFLASGIMEIFFSVQNKDELDGWGWYLASGIFTLLIGVILITKPVVAATTLPFFYWVQLIVPVISGAWFRF